ncbi:ABC transporter ATP-binding protein [Neobacillus drentensis]|uniref:ABC transporter ATP-binding protein n=1 Tax=Neobacillus drentensis TaxID=220684 RepID=UPI00300182FF
MRPKIAFSNVSKSFNLYKKQSDKIKEIISFRNNKGNFYALKNLTFEIFEGEAIGIVGLNGSGKSTLSNLLAQIIPSTSGNIKINGETSLIAISAGLNNQLTGLENIELKCLMHGLKKEEIEKFKDEIIDFADIGKFINQPVKNYSSGMKSRLGFAISIHTNPDILIVDEALSVGDQTFYKKCLNKMNEFKSQGRTIIFISHSISQIKEFCDRVMWVHFGRLEKFDEADVVVKEYNDFIKWFNALTEAEKKEYKAKMLDRQYKEDNKEDNLDTVHSKRSKQKSTKKVMQRANFRYTIQFFLIFIAILFSATIMFGFNPVKDIGNYLNTNAKEKSSVDQQLQVESHKKEAMKQEQKSKELHKRGFVVAGKSQIFSDNKLKEPSGDIVFLEKVNVLEKQGNAFKIITSDNTTGYTSVDNINLEEKDLPVLQREIEDFLPLFPQRFVDSNEYFLSFINSKYAEVKTALRGLSEEKTLDTGEKILTYGFYSTQYNINHENISKSITLSNIDIDNEFWDELKTQATLKSNDSNYYYFNTQKYDVVIDLINQQATIKPKM